MSPRCRPTQRQVLAQSPRSTCQEGWNWTMSHTAGDPDPRQPPPPASLCSAPETESAQQVRTVWICRFPSRRPVHIALREKRLTGARRPLQDHLASDVTQHATRRGILAARPGRAATNRLFPRDDPDSSGVRFDDDPGAIARSGRSGRGPRLTSSPSRRSTRYRTTAGTACEVGSARAMPTIVDPCFRGSTISAVSK